MSPVLTPGSITIALLLKYFDERCCSVNSIDGTTHSPQVLGEVDENFKLFMLSDDMKHKITIQSVNRMDGFDSNYILEEHMDTKSVNPVFQKLLDDTVAEIEANRFEEAERLISNVREIVGLNNAAVIELEGFLKRGRLLYEKNH